MTKRTKRNGNVQERPEKPEGHPCFPHRCGMWAKRIRGRFVYFGSWREDPTGEAAKKKFDREWEYLKEGKTPPPEDQPEDGCTVRYACNHFLDEQNARLASGELAKATFNDYHATCKALVDEFGPHRLLEDLRPEDFRDYRTKLAKRYGVGRLGCEITRVRTVFHHALRNELIEKQVRFGTAFDRPSGKVVQRHQNESEKQLFTREEVHRLLNAADVHTKAWILLGLNAGLSPMDLACLPKSAIQGGWLNFPRVKTAIRRRVPLWKETVKAVEESLRKRPEPRDKKDDRLVFLTQTGLPWVRYKPREGKTDVCINSLSLKFGRLMRRLGINGRRSFYSLRHMLETIGGESCDQVAVDHCMGHKTPGQGTNYRHGVSDDRLRAVVDVVHEWLFPKEGGES